MKNKNFIKAIGIVVTVIGSGVNILTGWVNEKKMDEKIEKKVNEVLTKKDDENEEESQQGLPLFSLEQVLMSDGAIQKIMNYMNMRLLEPGENWPRSAIMGCSYERQAVDEILLATMDHPMIETDLVIERPILKMELFLYLPENSANNHIFQAAENTAKTLLGLIL